MPKYRTTKEYKIVKRGEVTNIVPAGAKVVKRSDTFYLCHTNFNTYSMDYHDAYYHGFIVKPEIVEAIEDKYETK